MVLIPEIVNNRRILYLDIVNDLQELKDYDLEKWVLFVIEDNPDNPVLWEFANVCVDKELLYMAAVGRACNRIDDLFDHVMVLREINGEPLPGWHRSDDDVLMTTWHHDFDEGFWFISTEASYENYNIDTVLVANLTGTNYIPRIEKLVTNINNGWLPSN